MSIEKIEAYTIKCDRCGKRYEKDDFLPVFSSEIEAKNEIGDQPYRYWEEIDGKHYCSDCHTYDEETDEVEPLPEEYECTNSNPYGKHEYREGCVQHCDDCDYYQPIERGSNATY
ncbi:MAG: hypothetical protein LBQ22_05600 [Bacteroidales bacterium]|jgi:hypothetical protein|nr:hypothetical protein [Bacteroidales bacterium]